MDGIQVKTIADHLVFNFMGSKLQSLSNDLVIIKMDNERQHSTGSHGFTYMGKLYPEQKPTRQTIKLTLHESLHERMQKYLLLKEKIDSESTKIHQCLRAVLKSCWTMQDIRDQLPDHLVDKIQFAGPVPARTREPGYAIKGNALAQKAYERMLFILDFHSIQKLFI